MFNGLAVSVGIVKGPAPEDNRLVQVAFRG